MDMLNQLDTEARHFFAWVEKCRDANLMIGPVNETLIDLYEEVEAHPLSLQVKHYILMRNS